MKTMNASDEKPMQSAKLDQLPLFGYHGRFFGPLDRSKVAISIIYAEVQDFPVVFENNAARQLHTGVSDPADAPSFFARYRDSEELVIRKAICHALAGGVSTEASIAAKKDEALQHIYFQPASARKLKGCIICSHFRASQDDCEIKREFIDYNRRLRARNAARFVEAVAGKLHILEIVPSNFRTEISRAYGLAS